MDPVPYVVYEAAVEVAGTALHWKDSLKKILRSSGVSERGYERYRDLSKFQILRNIWEELDRADRGTVVQRRIVEQLANLDKPDPKAPDPKAGAEAILNLRRLATEAKLLVSPEESEREARRASARDAAKAVTAKQQSLDGLRTTFYDLQSESNTQRRGYAFERLLASLFRLEELTYRGSYRTETDQIDGAVTLDAFTYLLEARWRDVRAADAELGGLAHKVERRIDATRGLFISMAGFREEAVALYRLAKENRLVLVDGQDVSWVLEGRVTWSEGLRAKVAAATIDGDPYVNFAAL